MNIRRYAVGKLRLAGPAREDAMQENACCAFLPRFQREQDTYFSIFLNILCGRVRIRFSTFVVEITRTGEYDPTDA